MSDNPTADLRSAPLFSRMSDEDLDRLLDRAVTVELAANEVLFEEGDEGNSAFVIRSGTVVILKKALSGSDIKLAERGPGEIIGEISLLMDEPRSASVQATTPVTLLRLERGALEELTNTSITAARAVFLMLLDRFRNTEAKVRHRDHMATLGTLSAGLAHDLNNPAAAVQSVARKLPEIIELRDQAAWDLATHAGGPAIRDRVMDLLDGRPLDDQMSALERSSLEDRIEDALTDLGVPNAWDLAGELAVHGIRPDDLEALAENLDTGGLTAAVRFIAQDAAMRQLLTEASLGSGRISDLVGAMKRHIYLDQAPVQRVKVTEQIDNTVRLLRSRLGAIEVVRNYADDLPEIEANGSELNQVWSNLLDNAADAIAEAGRDHGRIAVDVSRWEGGVRVVVEDNGTGIPETIRDRVFDTFFTTKPPGSGTGLGLDNVFSIVVEMHGGEIDLQSGEGWTRFTIDLPPAASGR
jgi:signal transduction histidine kinase